jgi:hypothetical protein
VSKRIRKLYSYSTASGVEQYTTREQTATSLVRDSGISGQVMRLSELDTPTSYYFTSARLAIEAFIVKAHYAMRDPAKREQRADWKRAQAKARRDLRRLA